MLNIFYKDKQITEKEYIDIIKPGKILCWNNGIEKEDKLYLLITSISLERESITGYQFCKFWKTEPNPKIGRVVWPLVRYHGNVSIVTE